MKRKPLKEQYKKALARVEVLMNRDDLTPGEEESLDSLMSFIQMYEHKYGVSWELMEDRMAKEELRPKTKVEYTFMILKEGYWYVRRAWNWVTEIPSEIKYFWQRGRRGWSDRDAWGLDCYLAKWMPDAVRHIEEKVYSCPPDLYDDNADGNECWKWKVELERIAKGFEIAHEILEDDFYDFVKGESKEESQKKFKRGQEKIEKLEVKRKEYMELFVKWFYSIGW